MDKDKIIENFRDLGLFIMDVENETAYPNVFWNNWGFKNEEMRNFGFVKYVHPDDKEQLLNNLEKFEKSDEKSIRSVFRIKDKLNNWHWVLSSCKSIERDENGQIKLYIGIDHDITGEIAAKEKAEKALKELQTIQSVNRVITCGLELSETITAILDQAENVLSFHSASVMLIDNSNEIPKLETVGAKGFTEEMRVIMGKYSITEDTPNSRILRSRQTLTLNRDQIVYFKDFDKHSYDKIQNWMGVPLIINNEIIGMMTFDRLSGKSFDKDDIRIAEMFSVQVAITLNNAKLYEETREMANTDYLTGTRTRRWMMDSLERECYNSLKKDTPLSLIMFDIDDFKIINDNYGHLTGDKALKNLCKITKTILRKSDSLCRSGGEEFIVLLPSTSLDEAYDVSERLRIAIENESRVPAIPMGITVSIGCAEFKSSEKERLDSFLSRVDKAMYKSKNSGKNRTSV